MHRYRLKEMYSEYEFNEDKPKAGLSPRYVLEDENHKNRYKEKLPAYSVYPEGAEWRERFERLTFATPAEAWQSIEGEDHLPPDTVLYRYRLDMKERGQQFEYTSQMKRLPDVDWFVIDTLCGGTVMIAMSEVTRFVRDEI